MMKSKVVKVAAAALVAVTLSSQAAAAIGGVRVQAEEVDFTKAASVSQAVVADEFTQDDYTKSQVELLISQIVADSVQSEEIDDVSYTYEDLYYSPENKAGYVIDFKYGESCGYIIMLVGDNAATPAEIVLDSQSPYCGKSGTYLYPAQGNHFIMTENGDVVEALQYTAVSNKPQNVVMMSVIEGKTEPAVYDYYYNDIGSFKQYKIPNFYCEYSTNYRDADGNKVNRTPQPNNCANIAGVIALNYWNKYFDNDLLKLNIEQVINSNDPAINRSMKWDIAYSYADIFYNYMNTNKWIGDFVDDWITSLFTDDKYGGTHPENCYAGFERLIHEKGYKTQRVYTNSYEHIKLCIMCNIPVFITAVNYYLGYLNDYRYMNYLQYQGKYRTGLETAHTFIAYGYKEYELYDKDKNLITLNYLQVADGWGGAQYFIMDKSQVISSAAIQVYKTTLSRC
ncbi:MAG: hypothetical protein K2O04_06320 [Clostridiales bacterium]|nr:hypothetical protein [Clostridiales bacterium]